MLAAPVDYGLTPAQTLAHVVSSDGTAAESVAFDTHWAAFRETVATLPARWQGRVDALANEVVIRSLDTVRVIARVSVPGSGTIRGVVVTSHGYANVSESFPEEPEPWTALGLVTVRVRVRGYPPSTLDVDDLRSAWILHKLPFSPELASAWIVRGAVSDIIQGVRCARSHFGESIPVALHGESLGGGLAAMAAAQLTRMNAPPQRLILALPSLGDWRWRALRYCNGAGAQVNIHLDALRGSDRENLLRGLMLYDAALHARDIASPTLAKLALRDDVVPAPSAAAIFNSIRIPRKWRFITRFGHFEGGLADARRHAVFERIHPDFADPDRAPEVVLEANCPQLDLPTNTAVSGKWPTIRAST